MWGRSFAPLPHNLLPVRGSVLRIQRKIQFEHVNAWLAQESPLPILGVLKNQACDLSFWNLAFRTHTPDLKLGRRWRDIRIQSRGRRRHPIASDMTAALGRAW